MVASSGATRAEELRSLVTIGHVQSLWSASLQEERRVIVGLPRHYEQSGKRYPVVYLLDAETQFSHAAGTLDFLGSFAERMPEVILIGVINTDRGRDLAPQTLDPAWRRDYPDSRAAAFLRFVTDELISWVDAQYRAAPYRVLVGHSFGGLFCVYAMTKRPEAFQAHIAISPSLWWDRESLVDGAVVEFRRVPKLPWLFLSWAEGEPDIRQATQRLVSALNAGASPQLRWAQRYYPNENHMSTPHPAFYDALEMLFADWPVDPQADLEAIEAHFKEVSKRYGYEIPPSAAALQTAARLLLKGGKPAAAIGLLRRAAREYPYMAESHYQLAIALERSGCPKEALMAYEDALRVAVREPSRYGSPVDEYRAKVQRLAPTFQHAAVKRTSAPCT